jgi:hypothetical protein
MIQIRVDVRRFDIVAIVVVKRRVGIGVGIQIALMKVNITVSRFVGAVARIPVIGKYGTGS